MIFRSCSFESFRLYIPHIACFLLLLMLESLFFLNMWSGVSIIPYSKQPVQQEICNGLPLSSRVTRQNALALPEIVRYKKIQNVLTYSYRNDPRRYTQKLQAGKASPHPFSISKVFLEPLEDGPIRPEPRGDDVH